MAQQRAGEGTYEPPVAEVSGGGSAYGSVAADFATPSASGHPGSGSGGGGGGQAAGYATLPAAYVPSAVHAQQQAAQQYNNAASQQQQFQPVYSNGQPYGQPAPTFGAAVYEAEAGGGDGNAHNPQQKMEINVRARRVQTTGRPRRRGALRRRRRRSLGADAVARGAAPRRSATSAASPCACTSCCPSSPRCGRCLRWAPGAPRAGWAGFGRRGLGRALCRFPSAGR